MSEIQSTTLSNPSKLKQVLVGSWNAVKPEGQGKAIMKVYDRFFKPTYESSEDREVAEAMRPIVEKRVGWAAVGIETALITLGIVKGYTSVRQRRMAREIPEVRSNILEVKQTLQDLLKTIATDTPVDIPTKKVFPKKKRGRRGLPTVPTENKRRILVQMAKKRSGKGAPSITGTTRAEDIEELFEDAPQLVKIIRRKRELAD